MSTVAFAAEFFPNRARKFKNSGCNSEGNPFGPSRSSFAGLLNGSLAGHTIVVSRPTDC